MSVEDPKNVRWLKIALGELNAAVRRIEQDSVAAADRFRKRVFERTALLASHPKSGGMHPEYRKARFLVEDSYLILYNSLHGSSQGSGHQGRRSRSEAVPQEMGATNRLMIAPLAPEKRAKSLPCPSLWGLVPSVNANPPPLD